MRVHTPPMEVRPATILPLARAAAAAAPTARVCARKVHACNVLQLQAIGALLISKKKKKPVACRQWHAQWLDDAAGPDATAETHRAIICLRIRRSRRRSLVEGSVHAAPRRRPECAPAQWTTAAVGNAQRKDQLSVCLPEVHKKVIPGPMSDRGAGGWTSCLQVAAKLG